MRLTFRTKLLASYVLLVVAVLLAVDVRLNRSLSADLLRQLDRQLERHARSAGAWLTDGVPPARVAARISDAAEARVTLIAADGTVIADSAVSPGGLGALENHADRPEVTAARGGGVGRATRTSATLHQPLRYVALAGPDDTVVRVAVPLAGLDALLDRMRQRLLGASLIGLVLAVLVGAVVARRTVKPLAAMTAAATRLTRGHYDVGALPAATRDEFGVLATALTGLATELEGRLGQITSERDRLTAMLEGMLEGVLVIDAGRRVTLANPAAAAILETSPLVDRTIAEVIRHPAARAAVEAAVGGDRAAEVEIDATGARARALWLAARPLPAHAGGGAVVVIHDVTRLRRLETVRRDFVANVSHELRTPVASIQSYAETLADGALADPATARKFVDVIHRNASRLGRLVGDLLTLSRLEARAPDQLVRAPVALADVAHQVIETVGERANTAGIRLTADVPEGLVARGDPDGVEQLLLNLIDNAIKYGKPSGLVALRGTAAGDHVELAIADDGPGIESRHLPRLFERFYRVDEGRAADQGGTGLGLAIVKHLAEGMGGAVTVHSTIGKGTTFVVSLPVFENVTGA